MRDRLRRLAVVVLVGSVASGCVSADEPSTLPDTTPSMTLSPTVTTTSPTPDADPTAALEAEITAFFEEYIDTVNESWTSEEALARRREMFADSCGACLAGYEMAADALAKGQVIQGHPSSVVRVSLSSGDENQVIFVGTSDAPASRLIDSSGNLIQEFAANLGKQIAYQARRKGNGNWQIIRSESL